jgi:hypothetical protein
MSKDNWFERLADNLRDAYFQKHNEEDYPRSVLADVHFDDGSFVEVELFKKNNSIDVYYYHADEKVERDCPNITRYIEDNLPDWSALMEEYEDADVEMDEWQSHGFADEVAYWRWKEG